MTTKTFREQPPHLSPYLSRSPLVPTATATDEKHPTQPFPDVEHPLPLLPPSEPSQPHIRTLPSSTSTQLTSPWSFVSLSSSDSSETITLPMAHHFPELNEPPSDESLSPVARAIVTPAEVLFLLNLLDDLDADASQEVARVKMAIRETHMLISEYKENRPGINKHHLPLLAF
ncbi:hypothetical protein SERLA73DRAFT_72894 [Serpula lacrymans var. lacrymans S7.3]|uniref:Uncharacterized protein n=2 Tax=Serpula lacrymans var. lacrymans TaxID=341189 RepID=F8PVE7_SERL3|nr:uncharacterized protein SERLADRAFT_437442 [Serpula lacrymans var. lacrymans S7.9]EGO00157.1 hypothetical protein SERLA73DRAFT_72894 [Serpula lacrymans var. lacrymans S7.3]EGO25718.1 hypothetical protein SERLADRAFT_437442 [Serpula lacrymans var. lacrymans S7.9]